jgi:hypothetical protein
MDYESYDGCFDVERKAAFLTIFVDGTKKTYRNAMDRVGFEPTTSAMPMPYPTRLDDRPFNRLFFIILHINICYRYI